MQLETIKQSIRDFLFENYFLGREDGHLDDKDSFLEHGIIDSTGVLQLVSFLEETYGITVTDEELIPENLDSVDAVAAYVGRKKADGDSEDPCLEGEEVAVGARDRN